MQSLVTRPYSRVMRASELPVFLAAAPISLALIVFSLVKENVPLAVLYASLGFSLLGCASTVYLIPVVGDLFIRRGLKGRDLLKPKRQELYVCRILGSSILILL